MNAVVTAWASSDRTGAWHRIDWAACPQNVRRLQARIVQATEAGRWGKVHALQWLLTHAVERQSSRREACYRQYRQKHSWGRQGPMVDPGSQGRWRVVVAEARGHPPTSSKLSLIHI